MPIRTATLNRQIHRNGVQLHRAMQRRLQSDGSEAPVSAREQALLDERQHLKEERTHRHELAAMPKPAAAARPAREARPAKPPKEKAPKAAKEPKPPKDKGADKGADKGGKAAKDHKPTRAEKLARKAEAVEAARRSAKAAKH